jgi:exodeoxyribonuclease V gamma subunit
MTWKLMWLLPDLLTQPEFAPLQHYLTDDGDKRKIHQLAGRVADLFDQYLVYRPQWLENWQKGERVDGLAEAQQWQAPLWARLVEYTAELGQPEWHRANLYRRFINELEKAQQPPAGITGHGSLSAAFRHCRRSIWRPSRRWAGTLTST